MTDVLRGSVPLPAGVVHGFTARRGARGPLDLLGRPTDLPGTTRPRWDEALRVVHPSLRADDLALVRQVHGDVVVRVGGPTGPDAVAADADGIVCTLPGVALAVRVADCVPVLLATRGGVAAVHAGWRGVAAGIVPRAVVALCEAAGVAADEIVALIGPHIPVDRFEVGPEVVAGIVASGVPADVFARPGRADRALVDLGAALVAQLAAAGVRSVERVEDPAHPERFFSWRGDGPDTGRQAGIVAWLGD